MSCPGQDTFALRREPQEASVALHDRHTQFFLQVPYRSGQGRLRDMAGVRRAGEVLLAGQGHQVLELPEEHARTLLT